MPTFKVPPGKTYSTADKIYVEGENVELSDEAAANVGNALIPLTKEEEGAAGESSGESGQSGESGGTSSSRSGSSYRTSDGGSYK